MARAKPKTSKKDDSPRLSPEKGAELVGLVLMVVGLLLAASFLTFNTSDPSFLHQPLEPTGTRNWIGPVGADLAAAAFGFLGLTALLLPVLALGAGWRRFRRLDGRRIFGRGLGALVLLVTLPALLQLAVGNVQWRGAEIAAGGFVGELIAGSLESQLSRAGSLLVILGGVVAGLTLLVQSTLGEFIARQADWMRGLWERLRLARARRADKAEKEQSRRRVMKKHLDRATEKQAAVVNRPGGAEAEADPEGRLDLPLRVTEKRGGGKFAVRRVKGAGPEPLEEGGPQQQIPFGGKAGKRGGMPPLNLLQLEGMKSEVEENELVRLGQVIRERCAEFGVEGTVEGISPGPVITVFEFQPAPGVKVSQIVNLQDDLALALKAEAVRIERLPGRSTLGIEVPNKQRAVIHLGHLLAQPAFKKSRSVLSLALGTTIHGQPYFSDLATMPHLLVAGATGSGKSVGLQSMITSILYKARRDEVQFIFIDPKRIELGVYANIPHLKAEVVVEPKKAANALRWAVAEMERRYRLLAELHVRSIEYYNRAISDPKVQQRLALAEGETALESEDLKPLPYYVIVIDELADLMMVAGNEVETSIARLAQMARAVGLHLIVATQRPSVDVLTGTIKANFPCRIAYATATRHDSRTILDQVGSEKLLGKGDMLIMPPGTSRLVRLHGAYVTEQETAALVRWLKKQGPPQIDPRVVEAPPDERAGELGGGQGDELFDEAARLVVAQRKASASFLQRRLRIGFSRAARLIDLMEQDGLLGPPQGSKPREVLVKPDYFEEIDSARIEP